MRMVKSLFLALALVPGAVQANEGEPPVDLAAQLRDNLTKTGTWTFTAPNKPAPGEGQCVEQWTFRDDGTMTKVSGEQVVESTWRIADTGDFRLFYSTGQSSTAGVDCTGAMADPADFPREESGGFEIILFNSGQGIICSPTVMLDEKGKAIPINDEENCWGSLSPVVAPVAAPPVATEAPAATNSNGEPVSHY